LGVKPDRAFYDPPEMVYSTPSMRHIQNPLAPRFHVGGGEQMKLLAFGPQSLFSLAYIILQAYDMLYAVHRPLERPLPAPLWASYANP
jgi:hypothetical protein